MTTTFLALDPDTGWLPEDPFAGLLQPNDDTHRGEGFISFLVAPKEGSPTGTRIENEAEIIFDWNDPIDTPRVWNTIDSGSPTSEVTPFSSAQTENEQFAVSWSGQDDAGGSGIQSYAIYVSTDSGEYELWDVFTDASAVFTGELGHTYAFYSIAWDNVGHREDVPADPQTIHVKSSNEDPIVEILGAPATSDEGAPVTLTAQLTDDSPLVTMTYAWTVAKDGLEYATGSESILTFTPDDDGAYAVSLLVTDEEGASGSATVDITVINIAPSLILSGPLEIDEGSTYELALSSIDPGSDTITSWTINWGDGDIDILPGNPTSATHIYADGSNTYTISATVTDEDGTHPGGNTRDVTVLNVAPTLTMDTESVVISEGDSASKDITTSDVPADTVSVSASLGTITSNSGGNWIWSYDGTDDLAITQATITASDEDGGQTTATFDLAVNNAAPVVDPIVGPTVAVPGQQLTLTGSFSDVGTLDTHTLEWVVTREEIHVADMCLCTQFGKPQVLTMLYTGDGEALGDEDTTGVYASGTGETFHFTPDELGTYTVTFTVTDDDGGSSVATSEVNVEQVLVTPDPLGTGQTVLFIGGSNGKDKIDVKGKDAGIIEVSVNRKDDKIHLDHDDLLVGIVIDFLTEAEIDFITID